MVPEIRIQTMNGAPINTAGDFVLYWMTAFRRVRWNFSLQRAVEWARELRKPLVIMEALRCDYPWASERFHRFILEGMRDNRDGLAEKPAFYFPFVEKSQGQGKGLLEVMAAHACVVVTDEYPAFFLPRMLESASKKVQVRLEKVDSNGLLPIRAAGRLFATAFSFRRFLQQNLPEHLLRFPDPDPFSGEPLQPLPSLPSEVVQRWSLAPEGFLEAAPRVLRQLPIDHTIPTAPIHGGAQAGQGVLRAFLRERLSDYPTARNHPDDDATSGLSPYLHFGQLSAHQIFAELAEQESWSLERLSHKAQGQREGWWQASAGAEAFLDELITWRELGFNMCSLRVDYDQFSSLPQWAIGDLLKHSSDPRPYVYSLEEFDSAKTHDHLWNAAQIQLVREGRIHNYLRMLWGKKILHWSGSPQEALEIMIELNNRYALDGRDPNSYTGILWILGRYDRPWGPARPVFGIIRYMSSRNTMRKVRVSRYLETYHG